MKFEKYNLYTLEIKDKFVVIYKIHSMFGLFTFNYAVKNDLGTITALECNMDEVYNSCGISKEEATIILNSYRDYLVCCGKHVEVK
jgi:hypothetical protein